MKSSKDKRLFHGLRGYMVRIVALPLLFFGIIVMFFCYFQFNKTMDKQVEKELRDVARATLYSYGSFYEDEYSFEKDSNDRYVIIGADEQLKNTDLIDYLKNDTGIDISLFYYDIRVFTTVRDANGNRINGTALGKRVTDEVFNAASGKFYDNIVINGINFYAYYAPVYNSTGKCTGIVFAGKPTTQVKRDVFSSVAPILIIIFGMMIIAGCIGFMEAKKLVETINKEKIFLGEISKGNLRASLDANILKRDDELGEMGLFTVHVQKFIRDMIERDTLTKLYTRRIGEMKIRYTQNEYIENGNKFCMVMGDIDHFKRFNDTYGHDCGDLVLKSVANVFNRNLIGLGYAIRWGGEEFIIIMENSDKEKALEGLKNIRKAILDNEVEYNDELLKITMTFGLVVGDDRDIDGIIKDVDELLYVGKEGGRNRIVIKDDEGNVVQVSD